MAEEFILNVNNVERQVNADPETPLLYVLRDQLGLFGTKYGCGSEQCGACSILIDGTRAFSCTKTIAEAAGSVIVTIEGIGSADDLHPIQQAFITEHAFQCGYCTAGLIVATKGLLDSNPDPDDNAINTALQDNLCRCGSHNRVIAAVKRAAKEMAR